MINSNKLKGRMREMEITQKDVAEKLQLSPPTVSQKLNGVRPMDLDEAKELATMLDIRDADYGLYFFTG